MKQAITKILIANRGEIACRVIRTARKMNIATVAVYSDADASALHVRMADESVHVGPAPAAESYLLIDRIIAAAKDTGADAIHPGYGFLSENPAFVRACEAADITFIGPSAEAMEAMGLKDAAKALMSEAGVPVTPGYQGENQDPDFLAEQAAEIGYPVLIKAVAGGGGKGMRKVEEVSDFKAALASCQREAASSFGNDHVLIEKYITSPRHIEVQIFGDHDGNVIHLFERDCSLQRRHQKVIEEAPAPGMTEDVRAAMTKAAIRAAKAVNYVGAGTVEFIVDGSGPLRTNGFWFMEMNTRLQVEHPVTEEITGLDLVELQIRVARGEELSKQGAIKMRGHAIEARLYAEDPANDFLPSIGRITSLRLPNFFDRGSIREDVGVRQGDRVSVFYDPMIAKLISKGRNRESAIRSLSWSLRRAEIIGLKTNIQFLKNAVLHPVFIKGEHSTNFIEQNFDDLIPKDFGSCPEALAYAAVAIIDYGRNFDDGTLEAQRQFTPWARRSAWRNNLPNTTVIPLIANEEVVTARATKLPDGGWNITVGDEHVRVEYEPAPNNTELPKRLRYFYSWSHKVLPDRVEIKGDDVRVSISRHVPGGDSALASGNTITAPMPGKVISVLVEPGETVTADQPLVILEAMKMEMTLKSPRDGVVAEIGAEAGALVEDGQALVSLKDDEA